MKNKIVKILILLMFMYIFLYNDIAFAESDNSIQQYNSSNALEKAMDEAATEELDEYLSKNSEYFRRNNIKIKDIVKKAINGELKINILDYIKYQINEEKGFIEEVFKTVTSILVVCIALTIINHFAEDLDKNNVSQLVVFFSILIVFIMATKDINFIRLTLKDEFVKFNGITQNLNSFFLASMVTLGKIGFLQFFQSYSNYIIGITTKYIYNFTEIMSIILIAMVLINNVSQLINANLLYKLIKKATFTIFMVYIFIVVINFSVQGYILYKADNIFINSIKSLSPSSAPVIGNSINNFFGLFAGSLMMIKDIAGFVIILFIYSTFGSSIVKIFTVFILYKLSAALSEPFNNKISKFLHELSDIMYIYLASLMTPIIIITIYYSITIKFLNGIFG